MAITENEWVIKAYIYRNSRHIHTKSVQELVHHKNHSVSPCSSISINQVPPLSG